MTCEQCAQPATVVLVGRDGAESIIVGHRFVTEAALCDRRFCEQHAMAAGWPFSKSEAQPHRGRKR